MNFSDLVNAILSEHQAQEKFSEIWNTLLSEKINQMKKSLSKSLMKDKYREDAEWNDVKGKKVDEASDGGSTELVRKVVTNSKGVKRVITYVRKNKELKEETDIEIIELDEAVVANPTKPFYSKKNDDNTFSIHSGDTHKPIMKIRGHKEENEQSAEKATVSMLRSLNKKHKFESLETEEEYDDLVEGYYKGYGYDNDRRVALSKGYRGDFRSKKEWDEGPIKKASHPTQTYYHFHVSREDKKKAYDSGLWDHPEGNMVTNNPVSKRRAEEAGLKFSHTSEGRM